MTVQVILLPSRTQVTIVSLSKHFKPSGVKEHVDPPDDICISFSSAGISLEIRSAVCFADARGVILRGDFLRVDLVRGDFLLVDLVRGDFLRGDSLGGIFVKH